MTLDGKHVVLPLDSGFEPLPSNELSTFVHNTSCVDIRMDLTALSANQRLRTSVDKSSRKCGQNNGFKQIWR